jgi:endogenous inhibitor of DNA gyrase (YacG/DUF329 family)
MQIAYTDEKFKCQTCGKKIEKNNPWQILKYCSKICRFKRINSKKRGK